jgi:hypothetical protein
MLTGCRYCAIAIILFAALAVGGATASAGDSFARKAAALRQEIRGYAAIGRPDARSAACAGINSALLTVLRENASLAAGPADILGDGGGFTLTFGSWVNIGGKDHRLVFLTPKKAAMGAVAAVFSQSKSGGEVSAVELVHSLTQGAAAGRLDHAGIIVSDAGSYLLLVEKHRGPEHSSIAFHSLRLENGRWQPFMHPPAVAAQGRWTVSSARWSFNITHAAAGWKAYDCRLNTSGWGFSVELVDRDARPLDTIRLDFAEGRWIIL